jgi:tetratricopeptide (TPR) repeat protein
MHSYLFTGLLCLLLTACATSSQSTVEANGGDNVMSDRITPPKTTNKAALSLLASSRTAALEGNLGKAEAYLERALRIDSKNAVLWHYMAKLRLNQGLLEQAAGLAAKSNSLDTAQNKVLQSDNWRIIAHARHQSGDIDGAQAAQKVVDSLVE